MKRTGIIAAMLMAVVATTFATFQTSDQPDTRSFTAICASTTFKRLILPWPKAKNGRIDFVIHNN